MNFVLKERYELSIQLLSCGFRAPTYRCILARYLTREKTENNLEKAKKWEPFTSLRICNNCTRMKTNEYLFDFTEFRFFSKAVNSLFKQSKWYNSSMVSRLGFPSTTMTPLISEEIFSVCFIENVNVMHTILLYNVCYAIQRHTHRHKHSCWQQNRIHHIDGAKMTKTFNGFNNICSFFSCFQSYYCHHCHRYDSLSFSLSTSTFTSLDEWMLFVLQSQCVCVCVYVVLLYFVVVRFLWDHFMLSHPIHFAIEIYANANKGSHNKLLCTSHSYWSIFILLFTRKRMRTSNFLKVKAILLSLWCWSRAKS